MGIGPGASRESHGGGDDYLSALGEAGEVTAGGPGAAGRLPAAVLARPGMPATAALAVLAVLAGVLGVPDERSNEYAPELRRYGGRFGPRPRASHGSRAPHRIAKIAPLGGHYKLRARSTRATYGGFRPA